MRALLLATASAKLGGVVLPFPDVQDPAPEAVEAAEAAPEPEAVAVAEAVPAPESLDSDPVAPWTPPTIKPDAFAASADAFKHPSESVVKDWETAPKVELFDSPAAITHEEPTKAAFLAPEQPVVKSKLEPIITTKRDDDSELAAIQQENPLAYGIVKALLLKKSLGLPLPGAEAQHKDSDGSSELSTSSHSSHDMFSWKPPGSASDELSEVVDDPIAPKAVEEPAAPEPVAVEEPQPALITNRASTSGGMWDWKPPTSAIDSIAPAAPKASMLSSDSGSLSSDPMGHASQLSSGSLDGGSLTGWLGAPTLPSREEVQERKPALAATSSTLASYMSDLN